MGTATSQGPCPSPAPCCSRCPHRALAHSSTDATKPASPGAPQGPLAPSALQKQTKTHAHTLLLSSLLPSSACMQVPSTPQGGDTGRSRRLPAPAEARDGGTSASTATQGWPQARRWPWPQTSAGQSSRFCSQARLIKKCGFILAAFRTHKALTSLLPSFSPITINTEFRKIPYTWFVFIRVPKQCCCLESALSESTPTSILIT